VADAPLLWFAALRSLLAGAVLVAAGLITRRPAPPWRAWPGIAVLGVVNVAIAFAAMFAGTAGVATGLAAVLANAQPLLIVLPAWALYRERPGGWALAGLVVGFAGLTVAALPSGAGGAALLSIAAAAAITAGILLARRIAGVEVVMLAGWQFLLGGLILTGWAGIAEGAPVISWTPRFLAALSFLALVGTTATYLIWFAELQRAQLVTLSAWTMLTPIFGVAAGWLLLDQRLPAAQVIGITLVLAALALILLPPMLHPGRPPLLGPSPDSVDGPGSAGAGR
jgi:drug/metabolite transporter (DMT)-like permease